MENEKITLSIIIPCYNCAETICECVESVVNEAIANNLSYEIIAVDDGSSDNTLLILNKLAFENKNIKVISQSNSGPSVARNVGCISLILAVKKKRFIHVHYRAKCKSYKRNKMIVHICIINRFLQCYFS